MTVKSINEYIQKNWRNTVRSKATVDGLSLPYPFSVPCLKERFTCFFYWDTYFINLGLLFDDLPQAKNNLSNMKFFVERMGYVPNGNKKVMFNRSQPPLYAHAVMDYYKATKDIAIISEHYESVKKEYSFWMQNRNTEIGLNQYKANPSKEEIQDFYVELKKRNILDGKIDDDGILHYFAEAESGWDFSCRFKNQALHFVQVDLNSILYGVERILSECAKLLKKQDEFVFFLQASECRKQRMKEYLVDENGIYRDYNFVKKERSNYVTAASLLPFAYGVSEEKIVCLNTFEKLEFSCGVSAGDLQTGEQGFQWAYPNMWPPLVFWAYKALRRTGLKEQADRVREKYLNTVKNQFLKTGSLWEKYDVRTGAVSNIEYESPCMLGWTAGVYRYLSQAML